MALNKNFKQQLFLTGIIAVLLIVLAWLGVNSKKATYNKLIEIPASKPDSEIDIFALLQRFTGSNSELLILIENLRTDSTKAEYIEALESSGTKNEITVFNAYALYLRGVIKSDNGILQQSADLFFEAGTHDPDSTADRTPYSIYSKRACDRILKSDPKNKAAMTRKATCAVYFDGSVMEGVGLLKAVESIDSNYIDAQHHLMLLALQSGQYEKAKKRLKKLLLLQPGNQQYEDILLRIETQQLK